MSIRLSMELPTPFLKQWTSLTDLDFILAHKVLEDKDYAEFFRRRNVPIDRELILDNSYHELGEPLALSDLLEAALRCNADYVVAPDKVGDLEFNASQFEEAQKVLAGFKIAVIMTGTTEGSQREREEFLFRVREADMLCHTFKSPLRLEWFQRSGLAHRWYRQHLLGVSELSELREWATQARNDVRVWSVDTGKPLKWALRGKKLDELDSLRLSPRTTTLGEASIESQKILSVSESEITPEVQELFYHNVKVLREACQ